MITSRLKYLLINYFICLNIRSRLPILYTVLCSAVLAIFNICSDFNKITTIY